jgi:hypothetical protein
MRVIFGLLGLLLTLFVVMQLVKTRIATSAPVPTGEVLTTPSDAERPVLQGNPKQMQEQYQRALDDAMKAGQKRLDAAEKP